MYPVVQVLPSTGKFVVNMCAFRNRYGVIENRIYYGQCFVIIIKSDSKKKIANTRDPSTLWINDEKGTCLRHERMSEEPCVTPNNGTEI